MSNLSQAEIDALLNGDPLTPAPGQEDGAVPPNLEKVLDQLDKSESYLSPDEKDILGEIGNICMGASATTMYTLLGHRVTITTPRVHVYTSEEVLSIYCSPFVVVKVEYKEGVSGKNLLILKEEDSILITNLLMGEDMPVEPGTGLDELHLSAMSEIMNQMIGASATSLSKLLSRPIDITPPEAIWVSEDTDVSEFLDGSQLVVKVSFDMEIEGVLKSELMQIMSVDSAKRLARSMMSAPREETPAPRPVPAAPPSPPPAPPVSIAPPPPPAPPPEPAYTVNVQPANYTAFDEQPPAVAAAPTKAEAVNLLGDIPLQVTVELGKTKKSINDILNMGVGSVIVLDKMAGELVDVVVNGKRIARGEVVVIDENYGVRITDIVSREDNV